MKGLLPKSKVPVDFPLGLFLGAASIAAVVWLGNVAVSAGDGWATIYSAVIGGFFAIFAVWGALYSVQLQIGAQADATEAKRQARLAAEFSMLPLTLDRFNTTAHWHIRRWITGMPFPAEMPPLPGDDDFAVMKACIVASEGIVRQQLIDIVALYFIFFNREARLQFPVEGIGRLRERPRNLSWDNAVLKIYCWLALSARCDCVRNYVTGSEPALTWERVGQQLDINILTLPDYSQDHGYLMMNDQDYMDVMNGQKAQGYPYANENWR